MPDPGDVARQPSGGLSQTRRFEKKKGELSDAWTSCEDVLQEGQINARAALVAGAADRYVWVCEREGSLTIRSCRTGSVMKTITRTHIFPWSLAEGPQKRRVWVGYSDGCIILFSASPPHQQIAVLEAGPSTGGCYCLLQHLDYVFAGYGNCQVIKWNYAALDEPSEGREGYFIGHTGGHGSAIRALRVHLSTLFTCGDDMAIRKWDINSCEQLMAMKGHTASVLSIAYTKKNHLWSASEDSTVRVWDPEKGQPLKVFKLDSPVGILRWFGNRIWAGCWDKRIVLFDSLNMEKVGVYNKHTAPITDVVCVASTQVYKVWTCGADKGVRVWHMETKDNTFSNEERDQQRLIMDLKAELDTLQNQLGRGRRVRANSCWEIDDVAYCSTQVARSMREQIFNLQSDLTAAREQQAMRHQQIMEQYLKHATTWTTALQQRYFSKLHRHWALQVRARVQRFLSHKELDLLQRVKRDLALRFFQKLQANIPYSRRRRIAWQSCQHLQLQLTSGKMRLAYRALASFAHRTKLHRMMFEVFARTPKGVLRMCYFKLMRNTRICGKIRRRKECGQRLGHMRLSQMADTGLLRRYFVKMQRFRDICCLKAVLRMQSRVHMESSQTNLLWRYYSRLSKWGAMGRRSHMSQAYRIATEKHYAMRRSVLETQGRSILHRLMQTYFTKLLIHSASHYYRRSSYKMRQLHEKQADANAKAKQAQNEALLLGQKYREVADALESKRRLTHELHDAHNEVSQQLKNTLNQLDIKNSEVGEMQQRYNKAMERFNSRSLKLAGATEVYKLLQKTELCVKQCSSEIERRQLTRNELQSHFTGVRECLGTVKRFQQMCLKDSFTDDEKLFANVSGAIHGKNSGYCPPVVSQMRSNTPSTRTVTPRLKLGLADSKCVVNDKLKYTSRVSRSARSVNSSTLTPVSPPLTASLPN